MRIRGHLAGPAHADFAEEVAALVVGPVQRVGGILQAGHLADAEAVPALVIGEALETTGPRIVVFEVAGVIDLGRTVLESASRISPSPGITIIRGGMNVRGHDVIVRHIRIRTGVDGS